jgi:hypothetical protein
VTYVSERRNITRFVSSGVNLRKGWAGDRIRLRFEVVVAWPKCAALAGVLDSSKLIECKSIAPRETRRGLLAVSPVKPTGIPF